MAYNEEKLARLKHLKQLAQKAKAEERRCCYSC